MKNIMNAKMFFLMTISLICFDSNAKTKGQIVIGSKIFTESYILSELAAQTIENSSDIEVSRKFGLGSTGMLFESLKSGAIDIYPDYTGTLAETILKDVNLKSLDDIRRALDPLGLTISDSLGFNNTYALAVREDFAIKNNLVSISDLKKIDSRIRAAFSYEFMDRYDGYQGLVGQYSLKFNPKIVNRMEHTLVYKAISEDAVDLIEVYSTDANIKKYNLRVLIDDQQYFPLYQAVWVTSKKFVEKYPDEWSSLKNLRSTINEDKMLSMNSMADIDGIHFSSIITKYLGTKKNRVQSSLYEEILLRTREHLWLVMASLIFSIIVGIPLGIVASRFKIAGKMILLLSSLIQTIPALALLCFLIPIFGVGIKPALVALCLYSLLPVVLNTFTALQSVEDKHIENARAFGLSSFQTLIRIELPLGSSVILAGVKTATIVSIGTATLAALIGAGGYGALIVSGLSLNNIPTILAGAIPASVMALMAHFIFDFIERFVVPVGLQKKL
jgi:osmoprotectant transport system permease protein